MCKGSQQSKHADSSWPQIKSIYASLFLDHFPSQKLIHGGFCSVIPSILKDLFCNQYQRSYTRDSADLSSLQFFWLPRSHAFIALPFRLCHLIEEEHAYWLTFFELGTEDDAVWAMMNSNSSTGHRRCGMLILQLMFLIVIHCGYIWDWSPRLQHFSGSNSYAYSTPVTDSNAFQLGFYANSTAQPAGSIHLCPHIYIRCVGNHELEMKGTVPSVDETTGINDSTDTCVLKSEMKRTWADVVKTTKQRENKKVVSRVHSIETIQN